jgi:plastocyanin
MHLLPLPAIRRGITLSVVAAALGLASVASLATSATVTVQDRQGRPVPDAVVFLESREAKAASRPGASVTIAQQGMQFSPRVAVVSVGTAVEFPNLDKVRHHVYSFSPSKTFELKLYAGKPANPVVFDRAGVAVLGCNIHDHMSAWVVAVETPHHGRTGDDGRITLEQVPEGAYRLRVWHAELPVGAPASDQPLRVAASGASATVRLEGVGR